MLNNGAHSEALVELVDIAPTLLQASNMEQHPGMQGQSILPLLTGEKELETHRDDVYCEYYNAMGWHREPTAHATMVRSRRHKLVVAHGTGDGELYNLDLDPEETDNLWDSSDSTAIKLEMQGRVMDRMAWTVDPLPMRQAPW